MGGINLSAFQSGLPFRKSRTIRPHGTTSKAGCTYREVSRRSPSMVEVVQNNSLDGQLAATLNEWGLPSSMTSPRARTRSLSNVENVDGRCEMTISVDAARTR